MKRSHFLGDDLGNRNLLVRRLEIEDTGPKVSSDGGLLLLKKLNERSRLTARLRR
jgi:hypothetical protein